MCICYVWLVDNKYKCCFINLQYNCSVAKSRVGSLPLTAFRIEAKLLSMPYQPSSDVFIPCHPPTLHFLHLTPTSPPTRQHLCAIHTGLQLSSRHTMLFYASALTHAVPHACNALCHFCAQEGTAGPWKLNSRGISTVKSS